LAYEMVVIGPRGTPNRRGGQSADEDELDVEVDSDEPDELSPDEPPEEDEEPSVDEPEPLPLLPFDDEDDDRLSVL
jgi:hypothetical protein